MRVNIETNLKKILDDKERSNAWLARKVNRSAQQIGPYVRGEMIPRYDLQCLIAHVLGVSVADIWPAEVTQ